MTKENEYRTQKEREGINRLAEFLTPTHGTAFGLHEEHLADYLTDFADKLNKGYYLPQRISEATISESKQWTKKLLIIEYTESLKPVKKEGVTENE